MYITCILPALRPKRPEGKCVRGLDFGLLGRNWSVYYNKKHSSSPFLSSYGLDITDNRSTYLSICVCDRFKRYFTRVWAHIVLTTCQNVVQSCIQVDTWSTLTKGGQFCWAFFQKFYPKRGKWLYSESIILACLHCYSVAIGLSM